MITQYDDLILQAKDVFEGFSSINNASSSAWETLTQEELILPSDTAFELGGNGAAAVSGIFFTTNVTMVPETNVFAVDEVFTETEAFSMDSSINYAKFVFIRLKKDTVENKDAQQLYALFRKLEYVRFHAFLNGFSIRISSSQHREVSRVAKSAVKNGISLAAIGQTFINAYLNIPEVEAVQVYMCAQEQKKDDSGAFSQLEKFALKSEGITDSLNVIFQGLKMDCSTCGQKDLCDEIDGLKDLHKSMQL